MLFIHGETAFLLLQSYQKPPLQSPYSKVVAVKRERSVFNIHPNPAEDDIMIDYPGDLTGELVLEMYDAIGQLVMTMEWQLPMNQQITVPIDLLPSGVYLVRLTHDKHRATQKNVKK